MAPNTSSKRSREGDDGGPPKKRTSPGTAAAQGLQNLSLGKQKKMKPWRKLAIANTTNTAIGVAQPIPNRPYTPRTTPPEDLRPLKLSDINEGIIVLIRTFDTYQKNAPGGGGDDYKKQYVRKLNDELKTELNVKVSKRLIIAVVRANHFIALPIYGNKHMPNRAADYRAEIIDTQDYDRMHMHTGNGHMNRAFMNGPSCRGRKTAEENIIAGKEGGKGTWLVVKSHAGYSGKQIQTGTVELNQPVRFTINVDAKWVGTLRTPAQIELVKMWHLEAMAIGMGMTPRLYTSVEGLHQPCMDVFLHFYPGLVPVRDDQGTQTDAQDDPALSKLRKDLKDSEKRIEDLTNTIRVRNEKIQNDSLALNGSKKPERRVPYAKSKEARADVQDGPALDKLKKDLDRAEAKKIEDIKKEQDKITRILESKAKKYQAGVRRPPTRVGN